MRYQKDTSASCGASASSGASLRLLDNDGVGADVARALAVMLVVAMLAREYRTALHRGLFFSNPSASSTIKEGANELGVLPSVGEVGVNWRLNRWLELVGSGAGTSTAGISMCSVRLRNFLSAGSLVTPANASAGTKRLTGRDSREEITAGA